MQLSAETLSAADVAEAAEDALEQEVGARPEITCPEEGIEVVIQ